MRLFALSRSAKKNKLLSWGIAVEITLCQAGISQYGLHVNRFCGDNKATLNGIFFVNFLEITNRFKHPKTHF